MNVSDAKGRIRSKIVELARKLGRDASLLQDTDLIPQTHLLDSLSLAVLIVWYEEEFDVSTEQEELTIDNFGTINLMVDYLERRG
jgi:acyl carrier protein